MHSRKSRLAALCAVIVQILVLLLAQPSSGYAEGETTAVPDTSAPAQVLGIAHGAYLRPVFIDYGNGSWYSYGQELLGFNGLIGKDLAVLMYFVPWSPFDPFLLNEINKNVPADRRPTIMLTWEPATISNGCDLGFGDGSGPLRAINQGRCDGYIRDFARSLKARPERFLIRLMHEMNIADSRWWPGHYGLDASAYVSMWQRVRNLFWEEGAGNVEFVWAPNYASNPGDAWNNTHNYYPGNAYVDWIGLSGYNWFSWRGRPWENFEVLFDQALRDFGCRYPKPVIISEIGSVDDGNGSKASWIANTYSKLADYPFVRGIMWFNDFAYAQHGQADFRVTTGAQDCQDHGGCTGVQALGGDVGRRITDAYIAGVRRSEYTNKLAPLAQATPPFTTCAAPSQQFALNVGSTAIRPGRTATISLRGFMYSTTAQISFELPAGITGTANPPTLNAPWGSSTIQLTVNPDVKPGLRTGAIRVGGTSLPINVLVPGKTIRLPYLRK